MINPSIQGDTGPCLNAHELLVHSKCNSCLNTSGVHSRCVPTAPHGWKLASSLALTSELKGAGGHNAVPQLSCWRMGWIGFKPNKNHPLASWKGNISCISCLWRASYVTLTLCESAKQDVGELAPVAWGSNRLSGRLHVVQMLMANTAHLPKLEEINLYNMNYDTYINGCIIVHMYIYIMRMRPQVYTQRYTHGIKCNIHVWLNYDLWRWQNKNGNEWKSMPEGPSIPNLPSSE